MSHASTICYLCGEVIGNDADDAGLGLSMDHVPPKQFYPKEIRKRLNLNLRLAPSHKKCNEDYRKDEEYFYHALYPMVAENSPHMGKVVLQDFKRRTHKPQTPAMIRKVMKTASNITQGGIHLPSGIIELSLNEYRLQRVVLKIARGVLCINGIPHIPESNCIDLRLLGNEDEAIEIYRLSWQGSTLYGDCPEVFSYKYCHFDNNYLVSLSLWESIMCCLCFTH